MPARIITGGSSSGKTEYISKILLNQELPAPVLCCLPSELLVNRFVKKLVQNRPAMGLEIININNLGAHLLQKTGFPFYPLSGSQMARAVKLCVDKNSKKFKYFGPAAKYSGFLKGLASIMDELKRSALTSSDFTKAITNTIDELRSMDSLKKLKDYELIYSNLKNMINSTGCMDHLDQLSVVVNTLEKQSVNKVQNDFPYKSIVFDGFHDFTGIQLELIKLLAEKSRNEDAFELVVTLTANPIQNSVNSQEIIKKLTEICCTKPTQIDSLFAVKKSTPELFMCEVPNRINEVREALRWMTSLIYDKNIKSDECAVIARSMSNYHTIIEETSREFDLPVNIVSNIPLVKCCAVNSIIRVLNVFILSSVKDKIKSEDSSFKSEDSSFKSEFIIKPDIMVRLVKDPFISWKYSIDPSYIENLWKENFLTGEYEQWLEAASNDKNGQSGKMEKFLKYLKNTLMPAEKALPKEHIKWINFILDETSIIENIEKSPVSVRTDLIRGLNKFREILSQTDEWYSSAAPLLGEGIKRIAYKDFISDLISAIESETYRPAVLKDPLKGIFAGSPVDSRGLSFKAMVILGMSEGEFPASQSENSFFLDRERALVNSYLLKIKKNIDPSIKSREAEHFEDLIKRVDTALMLTRSATTGESVWEPSPFWEDMKKQQESQKSLNGSASSFESHLSDWLPRSSVCCSKQEYLMSCTDSNKLEEIQGFPENIERIRTAERVISQREGVKEYNSLEYNGDLSKIEKSLRTASFDSDYIWSASQLESVIKCPLSFFFSRILSLKKDPEGELGCDARQKGNIVHSIFQEVFQTAMDKGLDTGAKEILTIYDEVVNRIMEEAPKTFGFRPEAWWNQSSLRIKRELRKGLEALMEEAANAKIEMLEASFGFAKDDYGPLVLDFDDIDEVKVRGKIDRVDRKNDDTFRVIDYKTGGISKYSASEFKKGKILQIPLYAMALWKSMGISPISEGFYWCKDRKRSATLSKKELKKLDNSLDDFMSFLEPVLDSVKKAVQKCRARDFTINEQDFSCVNYCPAAEFCWNYRPSSF